MEWDGEWSEVGGWSGVREQRDRVRQYMLSILATNRNGWCYCKSLRDDMCREYLLALALTYKTHVHTRTHTHTQTTYP